MRLGMCLVCTALLASACGSDGDSDGAAGGSAAAGGSVAGGGSSGSGGTAGGAGSGGFAAAGGGGGVGGAGATSGGGGSAGSGGAGGSSGAGGGTLGPVVRFGINGGHRNTSWGDATQAELYVRAGCNSSRVSLPERHLEQWGYGIELADMQSYASLGLSQHVAFLTSPIREHSTAPSSAADWELAHYIPQNLHEPITLPNGEINPDNYWGYYVYRAVDTYKPWVKVWEVWNEPDWVSNWNHTLTWDTAPPTADQLPRFNGSIFDYVRMLRVSYVAAKLADPDAQIATGGLGYETFLSAIVRYTDNPVDGSVAADYPETGDAYFDVVSFHHYPIYSPGNSDDAVDGYLEHRDRMAAVLAAAGVSGKSFVTTESGAPHRDLPSWPSGAAYARNYLLKAMVLAHAAGVHGIDWYSLSDYADPDDLDDAYGWMGLFEDIATLSTPSEALPTPSGVAYATLGEQLEGARYDDKATAALALEGSNVRGASFVLPSGLQAYVLWARATGAGEDGSATFVLNSSVSHVVRAWDYSETGAEQLVEASGGVVTLDLTASPVVVLEE